MNLHWPFLRPKPVHTEVRFIAATQAENKAARQRRADVRMELEIMSIHLSPEQRAKFKSRAATGKGRE